MNRLLTLCCLSSFALAACGDERPVLVDEDGGVGDMGPRADLGEADGGRDAEAPDMGAGDMGPPPDSGPPCAIGSEPAPADPTAGDWSSRFYIPGAGGTAPTDVLAIAVDDSDVVYIGGHFSHGNDVPARNVMAWEDGVGFTPLGAGLPGDVSQLELHPTTGELWAVSSFEGEERIHRWDGTSWTTEHTTSGWLSALAFAPDGTLFVGGVFDAIDGDAVTNLAAFVDGSWTALTGGDPDGQVSAILAEADSVCIGGGFANVGSVAAASVACHDGSSWTSFGLPVPYYEVRVLARDSAGALLAGGHFDLDPMDDDDGGSIARWTGSAWERLGGGVTGSVGPGYVDVIQVVGDAIYAAGSFARAEGTIVESVSRWDGSRWNAMGGAYAEVGFGLETNNVFDGAVSSTGQLVIGGRFTRVGDLLASHVAIYDPTFEWLTLEKPTGGASGVGGFVDALAVRGPCGVYAGGGFSYVGGVAARNVVRITPTGPEALGAGLRGTVYAMAVAEDGTVYGGGDLTGGNVLQYRGGATWLAMGGGVAGPVFVILAASDGRVWVGGEFAEAGTGTAAANLAVWDGSTWSAVGAGLDGPVWALLELPDGTIVVGGAFANAGGSPAVNIAAWDGSEWSAFGAGLPADGLRGVRSLAYFDGRLVAGGSFESLPGADGEGIARWNGSAWETLGDGFFPTYEWSPTYVNALTVVGDALFATGNDLATTAGGEDTRLAVYRDGAWAPFGELTDVSEAMVATEDGLWVGGTFTRAGPIPAVGLASFTFE